MMKYFLLLSSLVASACLISNAADTSSVDVDVDRIYSPFDPAEGGTTEENERIGISSPTTTILLENDGPDCSDQSKKKSTSHRLECFLWTMKVDVPNFKETKDYVTIKIDHMTCSQFQVTDILSTYLPSNSSTSGSNSSSIVSPPKILVNATGLSAVCHGKYAVSGGLSGDIRATVATAEGMDGLELGIDVISSSYDDYSILMPRQIKTTSCETHIRVPRHGIHFSGSISAKIIDLFSKSIAGYVSSALSSDQLCPLAIQYVDPNVSSFLERATDYLSQFLPHNLGDPTSEDKQQLEVKEPMTSIQKQQDVPNQRPFGIGTSMTRLLGTIFDTEYETEETYSSTATKVTTTRAPGTFPVVHGLLTGANFLLRNYLNRGFLPLPDKDNMTSREVCGDGDDEEDDCGYFFDGFAGILRSITGGNVTILTPRLLRNLTIALPYGSTLYLQVGRITLSGLDQVDLLRLLDPRSITSDSEESNFDVLHSAITSEKGWTIDSRVNLKVVPGSKEETNSMMFAADVLEESFDLRLNISNIHAMVNTRVLVQDWEDMSLLTVVRAIENIVDGVNKTSSLRCLLSTIQSVELLEPNMMARAIFESVSISPIQGVRTTISTIEDDLDGVANNVFKLALNEYPLYVATVTEGILKGPGRRALNDYVEDLLSTRNLSEMDKSDSTTLLIDTPLFDTNAICPSRFPRDRPEWVNFTRFEILSKFNRYLNHAETLDSINHYLECLSKVYVNHHQSRLQRKSLMDDNHFSIRIHELDLNHLGSVQRLELLSPSAADSTYLQTSLDWGRLSSGDDELPQAFVSLEISYPAFDMFALLNITAFLGNVNVIVGTRVDYDLNKLSNISATDVLSHGQCAAVPAEEVRFVPTSSLDFGRFGLNVSALVTTSSDHMISIDASTDSHPSVQEYVTSVLEWSFVSARDVSNKVLEKLVVRALDLCEGVVPDYHAPDDDDSDSPSTESLFWSIPRSIRLISGILIVIFQVGIIWVSRNPSGFNHQDEEPSELQQACQPLLSPSGRQSGDEFMEDHRRGEDVMEPSFQAEFDQQVLDDVIEQTFSEDNQHNPQSMDVVDKSLFGSSRLSEWTRHVIPILLVGTIALLASSNLSTGATVDLSVSLGAGSGIRTWNVPALFTFSLGNTAVNLFQARSFALFFLVVSFSGVWPYTKLLLMMKAWLMSAPPQRRGRLLLMLDALGKFSLVDTYVLVVFLVAFRYHLDLGGVAAAVDVYVSPHYGFYSFLIATCVSLVVGHVMVHFHRRSVRQEEIVSTVEESIFDHEFEVTENGLRRRLSRFFRFLLLLCSLAVVALLVLGSTKESFTFEFGGLAGMALEERRSAKYSLLTIGTSIPQSVENNADIGVRLLQVSYFFFALVTPVACVLLLIILQVKPLTLPVQHTVLVVAEICNAWSAVEVFVLSIVAALFQISTFSDFLIGHRCDVINEVLKHNFGDEIPPRDAVCYTVEAFVSRDCWILGMGVLLNSFLVSFVLRFARCAIEERQSRSSRLDAQIPSSSVLLDEDDALLAAADSSTIAKFWYGLPVMNVIMFASSQGTTTSTGVNGSGGQQQGDGEEEEDPPQWRHWF